MNRYSLGDYEAFEGKDASKPIYFFITSPYMGIAPPTPIYFIMDPFFDCLPQFAQLISLLCPPLEWKKCDISRV